ncbi:MAG: hypothetical protein KBB14_19595 [Thermoanaerobaculia bacterium]|nr:hypothetical protein [Thermoanaerobaculia bacterium]
MIESGDRLPGPGPSALQEQTVLVSAPVRVERASKTVGTVLLAAAGLLPLIHLWPVVLSVVGGRKAA